MTTGTLPTVDSAVFFADDKLKAYLKDEVGLDLSRVDLEVLVSTIQNSQSGFDSFERFSASVSSLIAVHETYFLRHKEQFDWIEKKWLPQMLKAGVSHNGIVRILSAGCATGEEPYSLCAHLKPVFERHGLMLEIDAVDICSDSLDAAKKGRYSLWSLRGVSVEQEQQWLEVNTRSVEVKSWVKDSVSFHRHNITRAFPLVNIKQYDLILCRNVMIYMHTDAINRAFRHLSDLLKPDGVLIPGPSDPNPMGDTDLQWSWDGGVRLFTKKNTQHQHVANNHQAADSESTPGNNAHNAKAATGVVSDEAQAGKAVNNETAEVLFAYADVEALIRACQYDQARQALEKNIETNVLDVRSYVMLAVLAMDLQELRLAAIAARTALFLQPDAPYTSYLMANYKHAIGDKDGEKNALLWVKEKLMQMEAGEPVEFCEEFTVAELLLVTDARLACQSNNNNNNSNNKNNSNSNSNSKKS